MQEVTLVASVVFALLYVQRFYSTKDINKENRELIKKNITLEVKLSTTETLLSQTVERNKSLNSRVARLEEDNRAMSTKIKTYQDKLQSINKFFGEK